MIRRAALLAPCCLLGCIAYSPDCPIDTSAVVGRTETRLEVNRELLRTQEAPLGNLITDAFFAHATALTVPVGKEVDLALINAGAIRDASACTSSDALGPGVITSDQLHDLLPFNNDVELVEVTGEELLRTLEHAVSHLGEAGEWGLAGQFLQVSHLSFAVDCAGTAAVGEEIVGTRVVFDRTVIRRDGSADEPLQTAGLYRVATNAFLVDGGDGYSWLGRRVPLGDQRLVAEAEVVAAYLEDHETVAPQVDGRIVLDPSCLVSR